MPGGITGQKGFWDFQERLAELSAEGDPLVKLSATVDFEVSVRFCFEPLDRQVLPAWGARFSVLF